MFLTGRVKRRICTEKIRLVKVFEKICLKTVPENFGNAKRIFRVKEIEE